MPDSPNDLQPLVGEDVVLDTNCSMAYVGKLTAWGEEFVQLEGADVHDLSSGSSTKDGYVLAARKHGVQRNRNHVRVRTAFVVSVSRLKDVMEF